MINFRRYGLYLLRWQASTPILALVTIWMASLNNQWAAAVIANLAGGAIFYFADQWIFSTARLNASWEVREDVTCADCGAVCRGYRLVSAPNYDRTAAKPEFRCEVCSKEKAKQLRDRGVRI